MTEHNGAKALFETCILPLKGQRSSVSHRQNRGEDLILGISANDLDDDVRLGNTNMGPAFNYGVEQELLYSEKWHEYTEPSTLPHHHGRPVAIYTWR
jgi:hypothetical protein